MYKAGASTAGAAGGNGVPPTDGDAAAAGTADEKRDEGVIDAEYVDVDDKK
jgi:molecular chaperone DnaK